MAATNLTLRNLISSGPATTLADLERQHGLPPGSLQVAGLRQTEPIQRKHLSAPVTVDDAVRQSTAFAAVIAEAAQGREPPRSCASNFGSTAVQHKLANWTPAVAVQDEAQSATDSIEYGPVAKTDYLPYARAKIEKKFGPDGTSADKSARIAYWRNLSALETRLSQIGDANVVDASYEYFKQLNDFAAKQLVERPEGGVGEHLAKVTQCSKDLLLLPDRQSRFPQILTTHQAQLFAYVAAPVHDLLKLLGSLNAQVTPDHEVVTAHFVKKNFVGKTVALPGGPYTMTADDAAFVAEVIHNHENLEKEEGRLQYIVSPVATLRANAMFFVVDLLNGALVMHDNGTFSFDTRQFEKRFVDLYFRHIDLVEGKIFRPQWGAFAVGDLVNIFVALEKQGLHYVGPPGVTNSVRKILVRGALQSIARARLRDAERSNNEPKLTVQQHKAIDRAERRLKLMKRF